MKCYVYKMTADNGGAPCIEDGLLSLAICKPDIRSTALPNANNWLFGFGGKDLGRRLIYIAEVTGKVESGGYYRQPEYASRKDCIYRWDGSRYAWKQGACFHLDGIEIDSDIGDAALADKGHVLLSTNFRYLGGTRWEITSTRLPEINKLLDELRRKHRISHSETLLEELRSVKCQVWATAPIMPAQPSSPVDHCSCLSNDEGSAEVCSR